MALPRRRGPKGTKPAKATPSRKEAEARARAAARARGRPSTGSRQASAEGPGADQPVARPAAGPRPPTSAKGATPRPRTGRKSGKTTKRRRRKDGLGVMRRAATRLAADARAVWGSDADPTWFRSLFEPVPRHPRPVPKPFAVVILVLNVFPFPGLGTALYGKWERGLAQFLLTFLFLIGWVWAVSDGIIVVRTAWRQAPKPRAGPRRHPPPRPREAPRGRQPGPRTEHKERTAGRGAPPPRRPRRPS